MTDYVKQAVTGTQDYHAVMRQAAQSGLQPKAGYVANVGEFEQPRIQYSMFAEEDNKNDLQPYVKFAESEWYRLADWMCIRCVEIDTLDLKYYRELKSLANQMRDVSRFLRNNKKTMPTILGYCLHKLRFHDKKYKQKLHSFHGMYIKMGHL